HAAVIELDPLADPVRAAAEDHDPLRVAARRRLVGLPPRRVVIGRRGGDLTRARVDPAVHGRALLLRALGLDLLELAREPRMEVLGMPVERRLEPALRLDERLEERPADAHRLADGLHLRPEPGVGAGELLERK